MNQRLDEPVQNWQKSLLQTETPTAAVRFVNMTEKRAGRKGLIDAKTIVESFPAAKARPDYRAGAKPSAGRAWHWPYGINVVCEGRAVLVDSGELHRAAGFLPFEERFADRPDSDHGHSQ